MNIYTLYHKDEPLVKFVIHKGLTEVIEVLEFKHTNLIPYGARVEPLISNEITSESFRDWLFGRRLPTNRKNVVNILREGGIPSTNISDIIKITSLLSVNDVYWIKVEGSLLDWKGVNLYRNPISKVLAYTAFNGDIGRANKVIRNSPEYTTNGSLAKCWIRDSNGLHLYKDNGDSNEVYNEYYCSQLLNQLKIPHVDYNIREYHNKLISSCKCFTNEAYGLVPLSALWRYSLDIESLEAWFSRYFKTEIVNSFYSVILFDSIVMNIDRHAGNIGFLIDNNTNKILSLAPIYDNGLSLQGEPNYSYSAFGVLQDDLFAYVSSKCNIQMDKLKLKQHPRYKLGDTEFSYKQQVISRFR